MKSFRVKNLKSFVDSGEIEIKPITIFVGKNSCGKSSLLRFPAVLSQTARNERSSSPLTLYGQLLDYGNFEDIVHKGLRKEFVFEIESNGRVKIGNRFVSNRELDSDEFEFDLDKRRGPAPMSGVLKMHVTIDKPNSMLEIKKYSLYFANEHIFDIERDATDLYTMYIKGYFTPTEKYESCELTFEGIQFNKFIPRIPRGLRRNDFRRAKTRDFENVDSNTNDFGFTHEEQCAVDFIYNLFFEVDFGFMRKLENIRYIGPFRKTPERTYRDSESTYISVGSEGENVPDILINDFQNNKEVISRVSEWMNKTLGYRLDVQELGHSLYQLVLIDSNGYKSNIIDNGYGISQILPIAVEIIKSSIPRGRREFVGRGKTFIIEQPELHLHPAAQADLADLFAEAVKPRRVGERTIGSRTKLLIETHSEHLIRKLQVLIADQDSHLTNEMVKIYYVDKNESGVASVEEMKILPNGKFEKAWPSGFFDKSHELSLKLLRANSIKV